MGLFFEWDQHKRVLLDADLARVFPNSHSVNTALRAIIPILELIKPRRKAG